MQAAKRELAGAAGSIGLFMRRCKSVPWPDRDEYLQRLVLELRGPELREPRLDLLRALFESGFTFKGGEQPSDWWLELVEFRLEENDIEGARLFAERIEDSDTLLAMRIDRRFDAITQSMPERFDLTAAKQRELARLRANVRQDPKSLERLVVLVRELQSQGQTQEALALVDTALAAGESKFDDWNEQYPWILTGRGYALLALGKTSEGLASLAKADDATGQGRDRASFVINLALAQARAGKADEALATIKRVRDTSDYGAVLVANVYHMVHSSRGERALAEAALTRIRARAHAAPSVYFKALLRAGQLQAAKQILLDRLSNPTTRARALIEVQNYHSSKPTDMRRPEDKAMKQLLAMPDVRAAILEVGHIEYFDFPEP